MEPLYIYLEIVEKQYNDITKEGYYNVGPDDCDCVNTGDLVSKFCKLWGNNLTWINKHDGGPHEAAFLKLDNSKIKEAFGWHPRWHIDETIQKIVEWTKVYLEDKNEIPSIMDKQINEFMEGVK